MKVAVVADMQQLSARQEEKFQEAALPSVQGFSGETSRFTPSALQSSAIGGHSWREIGRTVGSYVSAAEGRCNSVTRIHRVKKCLRGVLSVALAV